MDALLGDQLSSGFQGSHGFLDLLEYHGFVGAIPRLALPIAWLHSLLEHGMDARIITQCSRGHLDQITDSFLGNWLVARFQGADSLLYQHNECVFLLLFAVLLLLREAQRNLVQDGFDGGIALERWDG